MRAGIDLTVRADQLELLLTKRPAKTGDRDIGARPCPCARVATFNPWHDSSGPRVPTPSATASALGITSVAYNTEGPSLHCSGALRWHLPAGASTALHSAVCASSRCGLWYLVGPAWSRPLPKPRHPQEMPSGGSWGSHRAGARLWRAAVLAAIQRQRPADPEARAIALHHFGCTREVAADLLARAEV